MIKTYNTNTNNDFLSILEKHKHNHRIIWYFKTIDEYQYKTHDFILINFISGKHEFIGYNIAYYSVGELSEYIKVQIKHNKEAWANRIMTIYSYESSDRNNRAIY